MDTTAKMMCPKMCPRFYYISTLIFSAWTHGHIKHSSSYFAKSYFIYFCFHFLNICVQCVHVSNTRFLYIFIIKIMDTFLDTVKFICVHFVSTLEHVIRVSGIIKRHFCRSVLDVRI